MIIFGEVEVFFLIVEIEGEIWILFFLFIFIKVFVVIEELVIVCWEFLKLVLIFEIFFLDEIFWLVGVLLELRIDLLLEMKVMVILFEVFGNVLFVIVLK